MNRDQLLDRLQNAISSMSDEDLENLVRDLEELKAIEPQEE